MDFVSGFGTVSNDCGTNAVVQEESHAKRAHIPAESNQTAGEQDILSLQLRLLGDGLGGRLLCDLADELVQCRHVVM